MAERNRDSLKQEFEDGERPSGADFADLVDSFINFQDDGVDTDVDGNLILSRGVTLGNSDSSSAGTMRYDGVDVQFFDGTDWSPLGGGGESIFSDAGSGSVAYGGGVLGIGDFTAASPTHRLDVALDANSDESERVRFGNFVVSNGTPGSASASDSFLYHEDNDPEIAFALRIRASGQVRLNAPGGQDIRLTQNGNENRLIVAGGGEVVVGANRALDDADGAIFQVNGAAYKSDGQETWDITSDARVKEDVMDLEFGLEEIKRIRPVRYKYTGAAGTPTGKNGIGVIGQEIEKVIPETVRKITPSKEHPEDLKDLRVYNGSSLIYVLVNSVKELSEQVEKQQVEIDKLLKNTNEINNHSD